MGACSSKKTEDKQQTENKLAPTGYFIKIKTYYSTCKN